MGKKTIKVPYTDKIDKTSVFCQNRETLLKMYSEVSMRGEYGNIIRPLHNGEDGYFFFRKKLPNGEMLISGECFPVPDEKEYFESIYYLDEDHPPGSCYFIEEESLVNDDDTDEQRKDQKVQQVVQELDAIPVKKPVGIPEIRVYGIDVDITQLIGMSTSDEAFVAEAERQGHVYTLAKFEEEFNLETLPTDKFLIKILHR